MNVSDVLCASCTTRSFYLRLENTENKPNTESDSSPTMTPKSSNLRRKELDAGTRKVEFFEIAGRQDMVCLSIISR